MLLVPGIWSTFSCSWYLCQCCQSGTCPVHAYSLADLLSETAVNVQIAPIAAVWMRFWMKTSCAAKYMSWHGGLQPLNVSGAGACMQMCKTAINTPVAVVTACSMRCLLSSMINIETVACSFLGLAVKQPQHHHCKSASAHHIEASGGNTSNGSIAL